MIQKTLLIFLVIVCSVSTLLADCGGHSCANCPQRDECASAAEADVEAHVSQASHNTHEQSLDKFPNGMVQVFHKTREPALKTLAKVKPVLEKYKHLYHISYHVITHEDTAGMIKSYGLPGTHFPFAIFINGKSAMRSDDKNIVFFDFPEFMHGIGRHEGNWSVAALERALSNPSSLLSENLIPEHSHDHGNHHECHHAHGDNHECHHAHGHHHE